MKKQKKFKTSLESDFLDLKKVNYNNNNHCKLLFDLLSNRSYGISHNKMPDYKSHLNFIKNNPYRKWFLVSYKEIIIGSVYILYDNGIGLDIDSTYNSLIDNILRKIFFKIKPLKPIPSIRNEFFHINVHPLNNEVKKILINFGGYLSQETYLFRKTAR